MKNTIYLLVVCLFLTLSTTSNAGTIMLGAKVWQSWWDSAVGDYTAEAADASLEELFAEGGYL
ncbi:MAG: hypothetical protein GY726_17705 [Proteobacteria bacterium]|nr:hypothetical protein [Pseudomonadota bacterium]